MFSAQCTGFPAKDEENDDGRHPPRSRSGLGILDKAAWRRDLLLCVAGLNLPDCWIAAGFLRNPIWDHLHGFADPTPLNDVDVVFFDPADPSKAPEQALETELRRRAPGQAWSVRNQARMHAHNGDRPYDCSATAMCHWLERVSAVGIRLLSPGEADLLAPFGFDDIFDLRVQPTPHGRDRRPRAYRRRMAAKNWPVIWPRVTVLEA